MSLKIKQSEKTQSEFISSVSHELRTPLTAITGWAETIQSGELRDPKDVHKGMDIIVSEARRLTNMVEELLEFSRMSDGRFTLSVEPLDLKAELEDAVYTYREFFRREGIELTYQDCPEEELPHVKYKFYKGSSKARGSGIGLAVCEEIVTRHEGTLDIENAEGGGCLVTLRLPIET